MLVGTAAAVSLAAVAPAVAALRTTNSPATFPVRVTVTDQGVTMHPDHAVRGSTVIFVITNRGTKKHTMVLGDTTRGVGKRTGFARSLAPDEQKSIVLFLDYRGNLPYYIDTGRNQKRGNFRIT